MKLKNFPKKEKSFLKRIYSGSLFPKFEIPKIILTKKEAEEMGLDSNNKKGYFIKMNGRRVLVDIE